MAFLAFKIKVILIEWNEIETYYLTPKQGKADTHYLGISFACKINITMSHLLKMTATVHCRCYYYSIRLLQKQRGLLLSTLR